MIEPGQLLKDASGNVLCRFGEHNYELRVVGVALSCGHWREAPTTTMVDLGRDHLDIPPPDVTPGAPLWCAVCERTCEVIKVAQKSEHTT